MVFLCFAGAPLAFRKATRLGTNPARHWYPGDRTRYYHDHSLFGGCLAVRSSGMRHLWSVSSLAARIESFLVDQYIVLAVI